MAIPHNSFMIAGSSVAIVLTASIPTLLPFTAALPSSRFLLPRKKTAKVDVTSDWSDPTRPGWLHCFTSGSWLPTQLITAPVAEVCAASQSAEGISMLSFRSAFALIGHTPRDLRHVSTASAPRTYFVILIFAYEKKILTPRNHIDSVNSAINNDAPTSVQRGSSSFSFTSLDPGIDGTVPHQYINILLACPPQGLGKGGCESNVAMMFPKFDTVLATPKHATTTDCTYSMYKVLNGCPKGDYNDTQGGWWEFADDGTTFGMDVQRTVDYVEGP